MMVRVMLAGLLMSVPFLVGCGRSSTPEAASTDELSSYLEANPEFNNNDDPDAGAQPESE